jgi:hypothetical protein
MGALEMLLEALVCHELSLRALRTSGIRRIADASGARLRRVADALGPRILGPTNLPAGILRPTDAPRSGILRTALSGAAGIAPLPVHPASVDRLPSGAGRSHAR